MDFHEHVIAALARERLDAARAATARRALLAAGRPPGRTLRARAGAALVALGEWVGGVPVPPPSCASPGGHRG
jgi:hypothetical protein